MPLETPLLFALLGCGQPTDDTAPAAWTFDPGAAGQPALTPDDVTASLEALYALLPTLDPDVGFAAYEEVLRRGDGTCPAVDPLFFPQLYWEDDCDTEAGAHFDGWALSYISRGAVINGETCAVDSNYYGFAQVMDDAGDWNGWGELRDFECTNPNGTAHADATWRGELRYPGAGWLDNGALSFELTGSFQADAGGTYSVFDGGLSGVEGDAPGFWFNALTFAQEGFQLVAVDDCPLEPDGAVTAFGVDGVAYDVTFGAPGACDGCGDISVAGVAFGLACPDDAALMDWEGRPWG